MNHIEQGIAAAALTTDLAGYQPLDSDLTAIAALTTTAYGRAFLALADAAAARSAAAAAPVAAKYIVQTADSELSAEQSLGALATGLVKNTTATGVLSIGAAGTDYATSDADLATSDITTNNSSTSKHGFLKKLSNVSAEFMNGTGAWSTPAGGTTIGRTQLVYRYTVTGSDKASIDTGADTADAGDNDWTGGDLLEVFLVGRTDDAAVQADCLITLNNNTGSVYDRQFVQGANATASAGSNVAAASWDVLFRGSGGLASQAGHFSLRMVNFTGTTFNKECDLTTNAPDSTAGNQSSLLYSLGYRSTAAITRLKVAGLGAAKFKVGTQLLIYKRLAS